MQPIIFLIIASVTALGSVEGGNGGNNGAFCTSLDQCSKGLICNEKINICTCLSPNDSLYDFDEGVCTLLSQASCQLGKENLERCTQNSKCTPDANSKSGALCKCNAGFVSNANRECVNYEANISATGLNNNANGNSTLGAMSQVKQQSSSSTPRPSTPSTPRPGNVKIDDVCVTSAQAPSGNCIRNAYCNCVQINPCRCKCHVGYKPSSNKQSCNGAKSVFSASFAFVILLQLWLKFSA